MAKRTTKRQNSSTTPRARGKSASEAKIERITWFLLVMVFALIYLIPDETVLPNWSVPLAGAVILLGSGMYQYTRRMTVSPITWIGGSFMLMIGTGGYLYAPHIDLLGFSLVVFAVVIGFGILTGET